MILNRNAVGGVLILVLMILFLYNIRNLILQYEEENIEDVAQVVQEKEESKDKKVK